MAYRNPFDKCCEDKCCDKCKDKKLEIVAWDCIGVDKSEENIYTINNLAETTVESTDWTVDVKLKSGSTICKKHYDLSVNCEDKKVWVCDMDTPWFLDDKIRVEWTLTKTTTCSKNWYITLRAEEWKDEKVAVMSGCNADYLSNVLESTSSYVDFDIVNCKMVLKDKQTWQKPIMVVRLLSTTIQQQAVDDWRKGIQTDYDYILARNRWEAQSDIIIPSDYWMELSIWEASWPWIEHWLDSNGFCVCPMDWIYRVSFGWTLEISAWVIAYRTYLYHWGWTNIICLESRMWGSLWEIPTWQAEWIPMWYTINWPQTQRASLGKFVPRSPFSRTWIIRARKGDKFALWIKVSTSLTDPNYDYTKDAQFQIQSSTQQWPWGWDQGAFYTIEWVAPYVE